MPYLYYCVALLIVVTSSSLVLILFELAYDYYFLTTPITVVETVT